MDLFAESSECASVTYLDLGFETRWISFGLVCYAKTIKATIQISCTTSFIDSILWWTDVYNNLFQIMQQDNFRNLIRVVFTQWKHLESRVNLFWYCLKVIKQYTFHYLMRSVPTTGKQSSFEILQLFDKWR